MEPTNNGAHGPGARDVFTFVVAGEAGGGVRKAGLSAARLLARRGLSVFEMDDYQSLIRGGHNSCTVSASPRPLSSHYGDADLAVALDRRSNELCAGRLAPGGVVVYNADAPGAGTGVGLHLTAEARRYPDPALRTGLGAVAVLAAAVGMTSGELDGLVRQEYARDLENNLAYASAIHALASPLVGGRFALPRGGRPRPLLTGNEAIALGAAAGGLDVLVSYPMTPASSILHYLAAHDRELGLVVVHPENELAVVNMAIGAAFAGARSMVASSGGGFALMEEAFSLAGMTECPLLCVLSSRPGPSTGVPTYTAQGDLRFALGQGHGEFARIVASPGTAGEAFHLAAELLALVWRFQTPGILLTEKHLSESRMTVEPDPAAEPWAEPLAHEGGDYLRYRITGDGVSPLLVPPSRELVKWNSYEHDERGITTERPEGIAAMQEKRWRKVGAIASHLRGMRTTSVSGDGETMVYAYGSTGPSVLEALRAGDLEATVVRLLYLEPLPVWELARFAGRRAVVVEQGVSGALAALLRERAGVEADAVVSRYDGRPFEPRELAARLGEVI